MEVGSEPPFLTPLPSPGGSAGEFQKRRSYAQASHLRAREVPKPGPAPSRVPGGASGIPWGPSGVHLGPNLTQSDSNLTQIGRHWDPIGPNIYTQTPDQPPQWTLYYVFYPLFIGCCCAFVNATYTCCSPRWSHRSAQRMMTTAPCH